MTILASVLLGTASATSSPFPAQPVYNQPAAICMQFSPPSNLPTSIPKDFFPGDQLFLQKKVHQAFVAYYAVLFCRQKAGRLGLGLEPEFDDELYDLQVGLTKAVDGNEAQAEQAFSAMTSDFAGKGPGYFFRGVCEWSRGDRHAATSDWIKSAATQGVVQAPEQPVAIPTYVLSSRLMLSKLVGIKAPPWNYGGALYYDH